MHRTAQVLNTASAPKTAQEPMTVSAQDVQVHRQFVLEPHRVLEDSLCSCTTEYQNTLGTQASQNSQTQPVPKPTKDSANGWSMVEITQNTHQNQVS